VVEAAAKVEVDEGATGVDNAGARKVLAWFGSSGAAAAAAEAGDEDQGGEGEDQGGGETEEGGDVEEEEGGDGGDGGGDGADKAGEEEPDDPDDSGGADEGVDTSGNPGSSGEEVSADGSSDEGTPSTEFKNSDHTDLYTVKRDRDRAWEQAKREGSVGTGTRAGGGGVIHKSAPSARRSTGRGTNIEYGQWAGAYTRSLFSST